MNMKESSEKGQPVSIVVGGMHGIAKNIARMFHNAKHKVIIVDKNDPSEDKDDRFYDSKVKADLTKKSDISGAINQINGSVPFISNLVFSTRYRGPEEDAWENEIALGMTATKMMIERLSSLMEGRSGSVVLISSNAARFFVPDLSLAYHTVKAAIEQMTRYYAAMLGPKKIRVNAVAPVYVVKDESIHFFTADKERLEKVENMHPLRRYGRADDVANLVFFLCSESASFITGQIIVLDGGLSLRHPGY